MNDQNRTRIATIIDQVQPLTEGLHTLITQAAMDEEVLTFIHQNWGVQFKMELAQVLLNLSDEDAIQTGIAVATADIEEFGYTSSVLHKMATEQGIQISAYAKKDKLIAALAWRQARNEMADILMDTLKEGAQKRKLARMVYDVPEAVTSEPEVVTTNDEAIQKLLQDKANTTDSTKLRRIRAALRKLGYYISKQ